MCETLIPASATVAISCGYAAGATNAAGLGTPATPIASKVKLVELAVNFQQTHSQPIRC